MGSLPECESGVMLTLYMGDVPENVIIPIPRQIGIDLTRGEVVDGRSLDRGAWGWPALDRLGEFGR